MVCPFDMTVDRHALSRCSKTRFFHNACILYHGLPNLSRGFLKFVAVFFEKFSQIPLSFVYDFRSGEAP